MSDFEFKSFVVGKKPNKLVFFLHGYTSCIEDLLPSIEILKKKLKNTIIVVPLANMQSERNPLKKQWYPLMDIDPERKRRKPETSIDDIIDIYNRTGERISNASKDINCFISKLQKDYNISDYNTYIMGFSQGAMLAIYSGLTRLNKIGGIFSFAGIICGKDDLEKEISSKPDVYLFHGTSDLSVQYKTLSYTKKWLDDNNIPWEAIEYDDITHELTEEEMLDAAKIINKIA